MLAMDDSWAYIVMGGSAPAVLLQRADYRDGLVSLRVDLASASAAEQLV